MDGEANLLPLPAPPPSASAKNNLVLPNYPESVNISRSFTSTSSSSSSFSSSSPQGFARQVQAAFKRHRPLGTMQLNSIRARRTVVPEREAAKISSSNLGARVDPSCTRDEVSGSQGNRVGDWIPQAVNAVTFANENQVDATITLPSTSGTITNTNDASIKPFEAQRDHPRSFGDYKSNDTINSSQVESQDVQLADGQKKVQFSLGRNSGSQGADVRMATGTDYLVSHMSSLALTEMELDPSSRPVAAPAFSDDLKHENLHKVEVDVSLRSDGANNAPLLKRTTELQDQLHQFRNFLHGDLSYPMTQSSVVGSSYATTTLVNAASAPMVNSTYSHQNRGSNIAIESLGDCNGNSHPITQGNLVQCSDPQADLKAIRVQADGAAFNTPLEDKNYALSKEQQGSALKEGDFQKHPSLDDKPNKGKGLASHVSDLQLQSALPKNPSSGVKTESCKLDRQERVASSKAAPRKRNYDPELFFKVNGKLYQRLGKIGSGGSSEVHKVISSDCTIYALKKIKLKGRDYGTAYGFCQEIEVTDKTLLQEVMNGSMNNKDGRVKDDGHIFMVLEYGEIDLAHMLSQKWREMDRTNSTIDENWLRFYWQQILLAVNTIHEERIVHSDLKPANFLLVRGSLKLIDFGIAKAILSDTTNIQRDSQVGTLSYMSPEAFMCNETDANGNVIKCGRPSDIWSLGCILYQMVYGRTPFSEYKTFWAKFKVITDPNHEITYEPVSNPWLLDIMKKCLAWDRNDRWRIPQLLQHPFLVPPIPSQLSPQNQSRDLIQLIAESCAHNPKALMLCGQLQELMRSPRPTMESSKVSILLDEKRKLLCKMSNICLQLQEHLAD
ncbi:Mitogen-activated protein kinase kinase [Bertholletia excelsa]